ncbi:hypothetical protein FQR65_LT06408 [Abscondita terminalis]|nr:hypothetical protein FQR65_LT06408 [Abscondita terminalis]
MSVLFVCFFCSTLLYSISGLRIHSNMHKISAPIASSLPSQVEDFHEQVVDRLLDGGSKVVNTINQLPIPGK